MSVRSVAEAQAALAGGADLIDIKEPTRGSLGKADDETIAEIVRFVGNRRPVSAAMGELQDWIHDRRPLCTECSVLAFLKWGLAGCRTLDWRYALDSLQSPQAVTVAYADWRLTNAPPLPDVIAYARDHKGVLLIDTWCKTSPFARPLLGWMSIQEIESVCRDCRSSGVRVALAGSLDGDAILALKDAAPDWFAVRGAACDDGRNGCVSPGKVRELVGLLRSEFKVQSSKFNVGSTGTLNSEL